MYKIIDELGTVYTQYVYSKEADFEKMIVENSDKIFGSTGIYFDIKKLIGTPKREQQYQMDIFWTLHFIMILVCILWK